MLNTIKRLHKEQPFGRLTNVDGCERDPDSAYRINAQGTRSVALACADLNAALVYVSTDYIFDGAKGAPYVEDDTPNPLSVYGRTKLQGEGFVCALAPRHYIARTSWVYGRDGQNFVNQEYLSLQMGGDCEGQAQVHAA